MSDTILTAILGAVFNAGILWGTLKAWTWRIEHAQRTADSAHKRLDDHIGKSRA